MPNPIVALQAFTAAVAVKGIIDQKKANKKREADIQEQKRLTDRKSSQKKKFTEFRLNAFRGQDDDDEGART
ncbi:hypothetical protein BSPWISOXPB_4273 [uncultured Gammaproteobacteria bacterium]|jgi:hypothetical protein|nr:hypothetical protein BSPWISOXPB_4273 [uncultured Gammaproteobacteria bacterium]